MRISIASKPVCCLLLLWVALFFGLIVPGHQRGLITLPGHAKSSASVNAPYCPLCTLGVPGEEGSIPVDAPVSCAICFLKTSLELPAPFTLPPQFYTTCEYQLEQPRLIEVIAVEPQRRHLGRAPPMFA